MMVLNLTAMTLEEVCLYLEARISFLLRQGSLPPAGDWKVTSCVEEINKRWRSAMAEDKKISSLPGYFFVCWGWRNHCLRLDYLMLSEKVLAQAK